MAHERPLGQRVPGPAAHDPGPHRAGRVLFSRAVERDPEVVEVIGPGPRELDRFAKTRHRGGVLALQREAISQVVVGIMPAWPAPDSLLEHGYRLVVASQVIERRAGLDPVARICGLSVP